MKFCLVSFLGSLLLTEVLLAASEPKILYEEDPTALVSTISISIMTGASEDPIDKAGLSNFYSELMLRGNKKYDRQKFQTALERMGATLSAVTTNDRVGLEGRVIKENSLAFLKLIEECLLHPTFPKDEFEDLKRELTNEVAHMKNSNNRLGSLVMRRELFRGTPLERPGNGSLKTLKAITLPDVVRAYNNSFHRANIVFAIASPLKEAEWTTALKNIWLQLPDGAQRTRRVVQPKVPEAVEIHVIHKPKTSTGVLQMAQLGITAQDPDRYSLALGNFSFGGEPLVSRLFRTIRGQLGWTYAIGTTYGALGPLSYQPGVFLISSTPSMEFTAKTLFRLLADWKAYLEKGLDTDEVLLARDSVINAYPFEFETAEKRLGQRLASLMYGTPILSPEEFSDKIGGIKNKDLVRALKAHHKESTWLVTIVADKDVVEKQLEEEQKDIPEEKRIKIKKVYLPDEVVE